jgi:hypothetical protein
MISWNSREFQNRSCRNPNNYPNNYFPLAIPIVCKKCTYFFMLPTPSPLNFPAKLKRFNSKEYRQKMSEIHKDQLKLCNVSVELVLSYHLMVFIQYFIHLEHDYDRQNN